MVCQCQKSLHINPSTFADNVGNAYSPILVSGMGFVKDKASSNASKSPAEHTYNIVKEFYQSTKGNEFEFNLNEGEEK